MKISEFAKFVTEMIQNEKEIFKEYIENEDWESLEGEIYEYAANGE